jgi:hypothetical protein
MERRIKPAEVKAIRRRDIGRRKSKNTGTNKTPMIVVTSKARPRRPIAVGEKTVTRGSAVGFISSLPLRMDLK